MIVHIVMLSYNNKILLQIITNKNMKPNLSFSIDQNRVDYHYIPQNIFIQNSYMQSLSICQLYQKSLSSSFLALPQLNHLSLNSSYSRSQSRDKDKEKQRSSKDDQRKQEKYQPKQQVKIQGNVKIEFQPSSIDDLQLDFLVANKKLSTKNVLRNFGNAQNQHILHNPESQMYLDQVLSNKKQFQDWVRKLKLLNFQDYKHAWFLSAKDNNKERLFKKIYKRLCWRFYEDECIPYIFNSRLTVDNKKSHLLQIYRMLNGILNSKTFEGFKQ